ncbi:hypothetical protein [Brevibacillus laterosporus]|uniref:hypothetical protein n=1 Tax=Brevibacillus laterosporus TaxID=1465 RepID=UPI003D224AF1
MKKGTLVVTVRKKDYEVKYQLTGGVIEFYDQENEKHSKMVYKKASEMILDELEKQPEKVAEMKEERSKKEKDSKIENDVDDKKDVKINDDAKIKNDVENKIKHLKEWAIKEYDAKNVASKTDFDVEKDFDVDIKTRKLLDRLESLELENQILRSKQAKVGRKSLGVTRKVSLVLPEHLWEHVDMFVRVTKQKQGAVIRQMIGESWVNYRKAQRGDKGDE